MARNVVSWHFYVSNFYVWKKKTQENQEAPNSWSYYKVGLDGETKVTWTFWLYVDRFEKTTLILLQLSLGKLQSGLMQIHASVLGF